MIHCLEDTQDPRFVYATPRARENPSGVSTSVVFDQHRFSIGEITAFGVLISLPVAVLFMLIQRNLVANLVAGGVK